MALESIEKFRVNPSQISDAYSYAFGSGKASVEALELVCKAHGGDAPDAVFACAGSSKPMFFVEMEEDDLKDGMTNGYWIQAWTIWQRKWPESTRGELKSFWYPLHWDTYLSSVGVHIRLLNTLYMDSETPCIRSYCVMALMCDVPIHFTATMFTPGFDEENKTRPEIVRKIESADEYQTADQAAQALYKGVVNGYAHITGDLITALFSASTRGAVPRQTGSWKLFMTSLLIQYIATPIWRSSVDWQVVAHRGEHEHYLTNEGFFS